MIPLTIILSVLILIFLIYILFLARPYKSSPDKALLCDYAHRGLHGNGIPENSLFAFEAACSKGYGIELDVQLSSDNVVMVFHDYSLKRMTGTDKKLCELSHSELKELSLKDTDEKIPTLKEVLELVNGRVPILVELKGENFDLKLCGKVAELLKGYKGLYCIESFNPFLLREMGKLLPYSFRGILYTNLLRGKGKKVNLLKALASLMALNFIAKPNFISYDKLDRENFPVKLTTKVYKAPQFVWTIMGEKELSIAKKLGECPIFENHEESDLLTDLKNCDKI